MVWAHFYTNNGRKSLTPDVFHTFIIPAHLIHHVTETNHWAQNSSADGCFCNFQRFFFNKPDQKLGENCLVSTLYSIWISVDVVHHGLVLVPLEN